MRNSQKTNLANQNIRKMHNFLKRKNKSFCKINFRRKFDMTPTVFTEPLEI